MNISNNGTKHIKKTDIIDDYYNNNTAKLHYQLNILRKIIKILRHHIKIQRQQCAASAISLLICTFVHVKCVPPLSGKLSMCEKCPVVVSSATAASDRSRFHLATALLDQ